MLLKRPYDYDRDRYGHILDWDQYSFKIDGKRVFIFSGEFHYWRLPDRDRWKDILTLYKAGGLNCIRIYFHWGFHSPSEKKYIFSGNRDLEYLFNLCEELGMYVLCAPGPYICAETTAGGYPPWLLAREEVNIRHQRFSFVSKYDPAFQAYSRRWLAEFVPIMARHERTTNPKGCVIGLQIENEHVRKKIFQFGLDRHMDELSMAAREFGSTTPFFHNDAMELGSWAGGDDPVNEALTDIYGFDRYIIWCPREYDRDRPPRWETRDFAKAIQGTEKTIRDFGGRAKLSPIFLVELQGGWFNQWGHDHGFDEVYDYYGDEYTRTITQSFMNEGMTMVNLYMYYGGTNWGSIGDPDVYTSYDYGGCIREYGYLSDRLRKVRQTGTFARGFADYITRTDAVQPTATCDLPNIVSGQRSGPNGVQFIFLRNFNRDEPGEFAIKQGGISAAVELEPRASLIAVSGLKENGFELELSTLPWLIRQTSHGGTLWVFEHSKGELLFGGTVTASAADAAAEQGPGGRKLTRLRFPEPGLARIKNESGGEIQILTLPTRDALSLAWDEPTGRIAWGAYGLVFDNGKLLVETTDGQTVYLLAPDVNPTGFARESNGIARRAFAGADASPVESAGALELRDWRKLDVDWKSLPWKSIKIDTEANPLKYGYHSGHVAYRCTFVPENDSLELALNVRHRATIWCNGQVVGGNITYGYSPMSPGAKNGPDLTLFGSKTHDLKKFARPGEPNEIIILTESLGYNRGPFALNDFRNPRGILHTRLRGQVRDESWGIYGVDVSQRDEIFNTASLPGEDTALSADAGWKPTGQPTATTENLTWLAADFDFVKQADRRLPLRLHLDGPGNAHVFLNGTYLARYWGDFGPQTDFYLMDEVLVSGKNTLVMALYTSEPGAFSADVRPYRIEPESGNIREDGPIFATAKYTVDL